MEFKQNWVSQLCFNNNNHVRHLRFSKILYLAKLQQSFLNFVENMYLPPIQK